MIATKIGTTKAEKREKERRKVKAEWIPGHFIKIIKF